MNVREIENETELAAEIDELAAYLRGVPPDLRESGAFMPYEIRLQHLLENLITLRSKQALHPHLEDLNLKQHVLPLLERVSVAARRKLIDDDAFRQQFASSEPIAAYVLSVDIKRSNELMLEARTPRLFGEFILGLVNALREVVVDNYGIVDKFTGDGLLAFFPEFFAGRDAGYFALRAAQEAHEVFTAHYAANRHAFVVTSHSIGLGIGIDYGLVQVVELGLELSVVGAPVVYARRLSEGKPGETLLNQPAFEKLSAMYAEIVKLEPTLIDIKLEGSVAAYSVRLTARAEPAVPAWVSSIGER